MIAKFFAKWLAKFICFFVFPSWRFLKSVGHFMREASRQFQVFLGIKKRLKEQEEAEEDEEEIEPEPPRSSNARIGLGAAVRIPDISTVDRPMPLSELIRDCYNFVHYNEHLGREFLEFIAKNEMAFQQGKVARLQRIVQFIKTEREKWFYAPIYESGNRGDVTEVLDYQLKRTLDKILYDFKRKPA